MTSVKKLATTSLILLLCLIPTNTGSAEEIAEPDRIIINEFLYDPYGTEVAGEFVELHNCGNTSIDMSGWTISDQDGSVDLTFPNMTLKSGEFALIYSGTGNYSFSNNIHTFFMNKKSSTFSNTGDDIVLLDAEENTIDFISYGNGSSVDEAPADFPEPVNINFTDEGRSYNRLNGTWRELLPTPGHLPFPISGLLITEICPNAKNDGEFISILNPTNQTIYLSFCTLTDGEGWVTFPCGMMIQPDEKITVSRNASAHELKTHEKPTYDYEDLIVPKTTPRLSNNGDEVMLVDTMGNLVDIVVYGDAGYDGEGWNGTPLRKPYASEVIRRKGSQDTNTSDDWLELKRTTLGQTEFPVVTYTGNYEMRAFVSPDCSMQVLVEQISNATKSIAINLYEFTNWPLAQNLTKAMERGVQVIMLIEGSPVMGMDDDEKILLSHLANAGAEIHLHNPPEYEGQSRYRYNHAKYAIIDNRTVTVMTENWRYNGVPLTGQSGNRGWGFSVEDREIADHYSEVFTEDWNIKWDDTGMFEPLIISGPVPFNFTLSDKIIEPAFEPLAHNDVARITPVISPDNSLTDFDPILSLLAGAEESILLEQFYIDTYWGRKNSSVEANPNVYLERVIGAARRGVLVRVLLDSSDYNVRDDDPRDNDDTVAYLNSIAESEGLAMEAKLVRPTAHNFYKIHAKGMVVDSSKTLVSSINWNENSITRNREVGIIVESEEVAGYFTEVFEYDWQDDFTAPTAIIEAGGVFAAGQNITFSAFNSTDKFGIASYSWDVNGDNVSDSGAQNFTCRYDVAGEYTVTLEVVDVWGNTNVTTLTFEILAVLEAVHEYGEDYMYQFMSSEDEPDAEENEPVVITSGDIAVIPAMVLPLIVLGIIWLRRKPEDEE